MLKLVLVSHAGVIVRRPFGSGQRRQTLPASSMSAAVQRRANPCVTPPLHIPADLLDHSVHRPDDVGDGERAAWFQWESETDRFSDLKPVTS